MRVIVKIIRFARVTSYFLALNLLLQYFECVTSGFPITLQNIESQNETVRELSQTGYRSIIAWPLFSSGDYAFDLAGVQKTIEFSIKSATITNRNSVKLLIITGSQLDLFKAVSPTTTRLVVNCEEISCWVSFRMCLLKEATRRLPAHRVAFVEGDQLFFQDVFKGISNQAADITFTFKKPHDKKRSGSCLNAGFISMKAINSNLVQFWQNLYEITVIESASKCTGGIEQHVMCSYISGFQPFGSISEIGGVRVLSLNFEEYKSFSCDPRKKVKVGNTIKLPMLAHFKGWRKRKMTTTICAKAYFENIKKMGK